MRSAVVYLLTKDVTIFSNKPLSGSNYYNVIGTWVSIQWELRALALPLGSLHVYALAYMPYVCLMGLHVSFNGSTCLLETPWSSLVGDQGPLEALVPHLVH